MPSTSAPAPLTFDLFWKWLQDHSHCVIRAGSGEMSVSDHDSLHWDFFAEDDGRAVCQAILGKALLAEIVIERGDVLFVQTSPDLEDPQRNAWLFECVGGTRDDNYPLYSFVMTHGIEGAQGHQVLKH